MSNFAFRMMAAFMAVGDYFSSFVDRRVPTFGLRNGMTVVDYGCGPGRYSLRFSAIVGESGKVYAVDIQPLAIEMVTQKAAKQGATNIVPVLARGYDTGLPDHVADAVCAIDMFFGLDQPSIFLREVRRILKTDGFLILDDGHESREATLRKVRAAGGWRIVEETKDHIKYAP